MTSSRTSPHCSERSENGTLSEVIVPVCPVCLRSRGQELPRRLHRPVHPASPPPLRRPLRPPRSPRRTKSLHCCRSTPVCRRGCYVPSSAPPPASHRLPF